MSEGRIAVLGATSQIASDLTRRLAVDADVRLYLFSRRPDDVAAWLSVNQIASSRVRSLGYEEFSSGDFDVVINFVGVGDPGRTIAMAASIIEITERFDEMVLAHLRRQPQTRYIFLSSGAVFGSSFPQPANDVTQSTIPINALSEQDWYSVAKIAAECRHRALRNAAIVDLRVFNYFSGVADTAPRFFANDILRAIRDKLLFTTDEHSIFRDFITPTDFVQLIRCLLAAPPQNAAFDVYSGAPVEKFELLNAAKDAFGLRYEIVPSRLERKTEKVHYYSVSRRAAGLGYVPVFTSVEGVAHEYSLHLLHHQQG